MTYVPASQDTIVDFVELWIEGMNNWSMIDHMSNTGNKRAIRHFSINQRLTINSIRKISKRIVPGCNCSKCKGRRNMREFEIEVCTAFGFNLNEEFDAFDSGKHGLFKNRKGSVPK